MFSWLPQADSSPGVVHDADYFIDILNTDIFRKHSTSDSRDPFF
uniref:Uncharacterized protein n=1 Tax=Anguilla anguilla TaxID=7936 RepID=A0A0E9XKS9_ANGAN